MTKFEGFIKFLPLRLKGLAFHYSQICSLMIFLHLNFIHNENYLLLRRISDTKKKVSNRRLEKFT